MAEFDLQFNVLECPICKNFHEYDFTVSTVMLVSGTPPEKPEPGVEMQEFEALPMCPIKQETYRVTLTIPRKLGQKVFRVKQKIS
jgi:uncharacterized protein YbaR (Trm112 family)